jgi:hypothetical protein
MGAHACMERVSKERFGRVETGAGEQSYDWRQIGE